MFELMAYFPFVWITWYDMDGIVVDVGRSCQLLLDWYMFFVAKCAPSFWELEG